VNLVYTDLVNDKVMWQEKKFKVDSEYYTTLKDQKFTSINLDKSALIDNAAEELAFEVLKICHRRISDIIIGAAGQKEAVAEVIREVKTSCFTE